MSPVAVLILCTGNSARSQMAEALLRRGSQGALRVESAGSEPSTVHPLAMAVMAEVGLDISGQRSKHLENFLEQRFEHVITVCDNAAESCPSFPGPATRWHWSFPDPAAVTGSQEERLASFREVRDALESTLREWWAEVGHEGREG